MLGPRFGAMIGDRRLAVGWLSHFSPSTDQPVAAIFHVYPFTTARILAVGRLGLHMLAVLLATLLALMLWSQQQPSHSTSRRWLKWQKMVGMSFEGLD